MPLLPHTLFVHWFANVQPWLFARAQVFVAALHAPLAQTAVAFAVVQLPSCSVSFEIATPAPSFALQVKLDRSQKLPVAQSASTQQPPTGMQDPLVLHVPDWHNVAVAAEQPA